MTLLTVLITALILVPMALVLNSAIQRVLADAIWHDTRAQAMAVATTVRAGHLPAKITPVVPGIDLVQVLGPGRHVIASSPQAKGEPPISTIWPTADDPIDDVQTCLSNGPGCLRLTALRVDPAANSPVVYAGRVGGMLSTGLVDTAVSAQTVALIVLVGWTTWQVTGHTLRPVDAIRSQLADITFKDLSGRVREPVGEDEVARLARTINGTLARLESAVEVRRRFVTDASHELRTPIAGLRLQLEEARMHPGETELEKLIERALHDVDRLQAIVTDLLYLTGLEGTPPDSREAVDLARLVRAELRRRVDRLPTRLALTDGVAVEADLTQLTRVLSNLLDNAQRHARHEVEVAVRRDGDQALLTVSDDGSGIPEADRARVFERFTRLDEARSRDHGGTGLGLAIVDNVVRAYGGTIRVERSEAGGARFEMRLPLAGEPAEPVDCVDAVNSVEEQA
ncbi:sensor histidine kinase [Sphaerisporangium album]|uniref:histidine kinase n=1 Tax=Sphaerisporangium album TaxID=509200 RepID=A0A367FHV6_9ACTN|nr:HAMP domain-containing sensor histidine kinase [Sphaerisporangium album]RCG29958.1 sensor histidine kinase [Sphaerisporangium album]